MRSETVLALLGAAVLAVAIYVPVSSGDATPALSTGTTVTFLVPPGTPITSSGDVVIYIAQPSGSTQAVGCVADVNFYPIQSNVITDPGGGRATRTSGTITISQTSPVPDGTRVGSLISEGQCTANGTAYDKFSGVVQ